MGNAQRDSNYITTLIAVSNADGTTPVTLYADPTTHRLLVSATAGSLDDLSDVVITSQEQGDVIYFNGTNWVNLAHGTSAQYLKSGGHGANPSWDTPTASITGGDTQVTFFDGANTPAGDAGMTYNKTTDTLTLAGNLQCEDLALEDSNASHRLIITTTSDLTADHTLTLVPGDADRTLTISGNLTVEAASLVNQDLTTDANPQFATIELGHASDTTISRTGAGAIAVEGVAVLLSGGALGTPSGGTLTNCTGLPVAGITASTTQALGVGSIELGHASDTTIARVSAGVASIEGNNIVVNSSSPTLGTITTTGNIELGHASDTTIARVSAGVVSIEGVNVLTVAGGTLTGNITLGENTSIALDPAGSADGKYSGITVTGTAGAALAFGDLCYLAAADSRWELTDADAASTSGDVLLGMCVLAAAGDGSATTMLLMGNIRADAKFPALTISAQVYVSTTAGEIQVAQPSGTDDVIRVVGRALTADEIFFNPSNDYITHT